MIIGTLGSGVRVRTWYREFREMVVFPVPDGVIE